MAHDADDSGDKAARATSRLTGLYTAQRARFVGGGLLLLALLAGFLLMKAPAEAGLDRDGQAMAQSLSQALSVRMMTVKARDSYQVKQEYAGTIVAGRESDHGFDRAGLLAEVLVDEGARVQKGDILARLDMRRLDARAAELAAELAQAIAQDREAAARLDQAQATYGRYATLRDQKHISVEKFEQVKFDLAALTARKAATRAAVARIRAGQESLATDRALATITARFDGRVMRRYQDEGIALGAGTPVVRVMADQALEIHAGLSPMAVASLTPGEVYQFEHQGDVVRATLRSILPRVDRATRTVTAIFDVTAAPDGLRAGGLAHLTLTSRIAERGFWLPVAALAESQRGLWSAYSVVPDDRAPEDYGALAREALQVIHTDNDRVFVRGTLKDGDRVVTGGLHRLVPGQLVRMGGSD